MYQIRRLFAHNMRLFWHITYLFTSEVSNSTIKYCMYTRPSKLLQVGLCYREFWTGTACVKETYRSIDGYHLCKRDPSQYWRVLLSVHTKEAITEIQWHPVCLPIFVLPHSHTTPTFVVRATHRVPVHLSNIHYMSIFLFSPTLPRTLTTPSRDTLAPCVSTFLFPPALPHNKLSKLIEVSFTGSYGRKYYRNLPQRPPHTLASSLLQGSFAKVTRNFKEPTGRSHPIYWQGVSVCGPCQYMGWLRPVGSLKLKVSFAKEPCKRDDMLQKRPVILRRLLIETTPYLSLSPTLPYSTLSKSTHIHTH